MILEVLVEPDPRLHQRSQPVDQVDDEVLTLLQDMEETMYASLGIGISAPQVNVLKRLVVIDVGWDPNGDVASRKPLKLINPEIIWTGEEKTPCREGCLSVPGVYAEVIRPAQVRVGYVDVDGQTQTMEASDLLSVCLQHEIDHLNGVVFLQHLSALRREMLMKKMIKVQRSERANTI